MTDLVEIVARALDSHPFEYMIADGEKRRSKARQNAHAVLSALREAGAIREWRPIEELSDDDAYLFASEDPTG